MTVCIDTNTYSAFKRGHDRISSLLESAEEVLVPTVVLGELYAGFARGTRERQNLQELRQFLETPGIAVVPVSEGVARRYGTVMQVLTRLGTPIPTNDVWIAAVALETGARLVSSDAHFGRIPAVVTIPIE